MAPASTSHSRDAYLHHKCAVLQCSEEILILKDPAVKAYVGWPPGFSRLRFLPSDDGKLVATMNLETQEQREHVRRPAPVNIPHQVIEQSGSDVRRNVPLVYVQS